MTIYQTFSLKENQLQFFEKFLNNILYDILNKRCVIFQKVKSINADIKSTNVDTQLKVSNANSITTNITLYYLVLKFDSILNLRLTIVLFSLYYVVKIKYCIFAKSLRTKKLLTKILHRALSKL